MENVTLDGQGQVINGIANTLAQDLSYVDHVSLYQILGIGLSVSGSASNSGPYSDITFDTGSSQSNASTTCVQIYGITGTRGLHGITCISRQNNAENAILLDESNNSLEDVRIIGFDNGIEVGANYTARSNVLMNVLGDSIAPPSCGNCVINVVSISSSNTVTDLSIMDVHNVAGGPNNMTIADTRTSTYLQDPYVAMYALGQPGRNIGYSRFTTSLNAATWVAGPTSPSGVACSSSAGGSLFSNTSGTGIALWFCPVGGGTWTGIQ